MSSLKKLVILLGILLCVGFFVGCEGGDDGYNRDHDGGYALTPVAGNGNTTITDSGNTTINNGNNPSSPRPPSNLSTPNPTPTSNPVITVVNNASVADIVNFNVSVAGNGGNYPIAYDGGVITVVFDTQLGYPDSLTFSDGKSHTMTITNGPNGIGITAYHD